MAKVKMRIGEIEVEVEHEKGVAAEQKAKEYFEYLLNLVYPPKQLEPSQVENPKEGTWHPSMGIRR